MVRNGPREGSMAVLVPMSFCVAGASLCDILTCLKKLRKSLCVTGATLLRRFQKRSCNFCGMHSTLDVYCCVFSANRLGRDCVKWCQGANCVAGVGHGESIIFS